MLLLMMMMMVIGRVGGTTTTTSRPVTCAKENYRKSQWHSSVNYQKLQPWLLQLLAARYSAARFSFFWSLFLST